MCYGALCTAALQQMLQDPLLMASAVFYAIGMYRTWDALFQRMLHVLSSIQGHPHSNLYEMLALSFLYSQPQISLQERGNETLLTYVNMLRYKACPPLVTPTPFLKQPELW